MSLFCWLAALLAVGQGDAWLYCVCLQQIEKACTFATLSTRNKAWQALERKEQQGERDMKHKSRAVEQQRGAGPTLTGERGGLGSQVLHWRAKLRMIAWLLLLSSIAGLMKKLS